MQNGCQMHIINIHKCMINQKDRKSQFIDKIIRILQIMGILSVQIIIKFSQRIITQMREVDRWKSRSLPRQQQIRQSEQIMKRIEQLKEGFVANQSNAKYSQNNREKWQQYLPSENIQNVRSYFNSISSKDDNKHDHYRQSLQKRLERLFRQEKELLKQRHQNDHFSGNNASKHKKEPNKISNIQDQRDRLLSSNSVSKMQRKIKTLEEKYKILQSKQELKKYNKVQTQVKKSASKNEQESYIKEERDRSKSQIQNYQRDSKVYKNDEAQWTQKQKQLQLEVEQLKTSMREIKKNNQYILRKMEHKQERRKQKQRTKEILLKILHKLEFINVEVANAKKQNEKNKNRDDSRYNKQNTSKIQKETNELVGEFQLLKVQYKHLDQQRKRVQMRQTEIENKLKKISEPQ